VTTPDWLEVIDRPFPSSTLVLVRGPDPIVVDPGAATDADLLPEILEAAGASPGQISTVVCTHHHADHVGAVGVLQDAGAQVAAHPWDAAMVNARDRRACAAQWLEQPVLPYRVHQPLADEDTVSTGKVDLQVVHTPGHTLGGISLWEPRTATLICGDAFHANDTPWIGEPHEGAGSLQRAHLTLDRIQELTPARAISGHGPLIDDVPAALNRTRERLRAWSADPAACVLHAAQRILTYRLMLKPIPSNDVRKVLAAAPWVRDLAGSVDLDPEHLIDQLLGALSSSLVITEGLLRTTAAHRASPGPVPWHLTAPARWPT